MTWTHEYLNLNMKYLYLHICIEAQKSNGQTIIKIE